MKTRLKLMKMQREYVGGKSVKRRMEEEKIEDEYGQEDIREIY